ncbi:MAG: DUF262 domain-containing protein [Magnetococcales bacterium]|nr:DUF262 domain-containing protein [Magnetococcales bacterium]
MSETLTALASENLNPGLKSLLEDVQRGHIRVPRFQRPFVWTDEQRLELLRSIRDNMPVGSLLIWRTSKFSLASFPTVGPHTIPPIAETPPTTGWQYILDGHQRISSLLGLLLNPSQPPREDQPDDDDSIDWDVQYDLEEEEFIFPDRGVARRANRPLLPLWTLLDGRLVNKRLRELRTLWAGEIGPWTEENIEEWEKRADQLAYSFQQFRIPIVVMVTDRLELAAATFQRINTLGTVMSEAHLVAALTWNEQFDLRERIDTLREALPLGWRDIEESLFLKVCKGLVKLDITRAGQTELVAALKEHPALLDRAGAGIQQAIALLAEQAGVVRRELLPYYPFQLVLLAVELAQRGEQVSADDKVKFIRWFWRTSWSEVFSTASYWQIRSEHEALKSFDDREWTPGRGLPKRFDFRSPRACLFVLLWATRKVLFDANDDQTNTLKVLEMYGRAALVRLFSAPPGAAPALKQQMQSAGNSFLIDPNTKAALRNRLLGTENLPDIELQMHFIDAKMLAALRSGDLQTFIEQRTDKMAHYHATSYEKEKNRSRI